MCQQNVFFSNEIQGGLGPGVCCATSKMEALAFVLPLLRYKIDLKFPVGIQADPFQARPFNAARPVPPLRGYFP